MSSSITLHLGGVLFVCLWQGLSLSLWLIIWPIMVVQRLSGICISLYEISMLGFFCFLNDSSRNWTQVLILVLLDQIQCFVNQAIFLGPISMSIPDKLTSLGCSVLAVQNGPRVLKPAATSPVPQGFVSHNQKTEHISGLQIQPLWSLLIKRQSRNDGIRCEEKLLCGWALLTWGWWEYLWHPDRQSLLTACQAV